MAFGVSDPSVQDFALAYDDSLAKMRPMSTASGKTGTSSSDQGAESKRPERVNPDPIRSLPGYHTYDLRDYREFNLMVNEYFAGNRNYVWRGHGCADWRLESTLARKLMSQPVEGSAVLTDWPKEITRLTQEHLLAYLRRLSRVEVLNLEYRELFDIVLSALSRNNTSFLSTLSQLSPQKKGLLFELLAKGQDYKLLTALLDWSDSPFVALHFAFAKEHGQDDVGNRVVYALNRKLVKEMCPQSEDMNDSGIYLIESLAFGNSRVVGQAGVFTFCPGHISIEDWVVKRCSEKPELPMLLRFRIRNTQRKECLRFLDSMNINYQTIFPDWEGAALSANDDLEIGLEGLKERFRKGRN